MTENDRQLWSGMLAHLRRHHLDVCRQWFEELEPLGVHAGVLRLRAHSQVHRNYLQRDCLDPFNDAARTVSGRLISVAFLGPEEDEAAAAAERALQDPHARPAALGSSDGAEVVVVTHRAPAAVGVASGAADTPFPPGQARGPDAPSWGLPEARGPVANGSLYADSLAVNPDNDFGNFVVGPGNRLAHAAALAVASNPGRVYNPFFVHGDVGLGKTHLLQAVTLQLLAQRPGVRIYYTSCEGFMTQFIDAVAKGEMSTFRHKFRDVDVLVIDDIHFLANKERSQEEFFHTFNSLYQAHKQIVVSSDAAPGDIPDMEERLVSRFKWGLVASISRPDYETRIEILKNKARLRGLELPGDVAQYIAGKIDSNIRELEGAIVKIRAYADAFAAGDTAGKIRRALDLEIARAALGDEAVRAERQIAIQTIAQIVSEFYNVRVPDLQSKRRHRSVVLPRQVCMFLARKLTLWSLEQIGRYFGGRDHTTVMHGIAAIEDRCESDEAFAQVVQALEEKVKNAGRDPRP